MGDDGGIGTVYDEPVKRLGVPARARFIPVLSIALLLSIAAVDVACGGSGPRSPRAPTTPAPGSSNFPQVAGTWTGTIESSQFAAQPISVRFVQSLDCVDGDWKTTGTDWNGAISGYAQTEVFSGFISVEGSLSGTGLCVAINRVSGRTTATDIEWTMVNDGNCAGGVAQTVTFRMHR
jgi:hypothetical protein